MMGYEPVGSPGELHAEEQKDGNESWATSDLAEASGAEADWDSWQWDDNEADWEDARGGHSHCHGQGEAPGVQ